MWTSLTIVLLAVIITIQAHSEPIACTRQKHDQIWGRRWPGYDELLKGDYIYKKAAVFSRSQYHITYPKSGTRGYHVVTMVEILDRRTDGHGGCGKIDDGHIGADRIRVIVTSSNSREMRFDYKIYGVPKTCNETIRDVFKGTEMYDNMRCDWYLNKAEKK